MRCRDLKSSRKPSLLDHAVERVEGIVLSARPIGGTILTRYPCTVALIDICSHCSISRRFRTGNGNSRRRTALVKPAFLDCGDELCYFANARINRADFLSRLFVKGKIALHFRYFPDHDAVQDFLVPGLQAHDY